MDNQHRQIKGYRDLDRHEIDLMNRIKEHGEKTNELLTELVQMRSRSQIPGNGQHLNVSQYNESLRCLDIARTNLQTGQMWFVRAVALPESF